MSLSFAGIFVESSTNKMPKVNRNGKAEIWTTTDLSRLLKQIENPRHKLIIDLLRFTGERIGAVVQLSVEDVYEDREKSLPRGNILYRARTRKGSSSGTRKSRELPVSEALARSLSAFNPPSGRLLFPSPTVPGRHVTVSSVDRWFRRALYKAGLTDRGYSLHSFRRTALTILRKKGVDIRLIQQFSGHASLDSLQRYLDADPGEVSEIVDYL